MEQFSPVSAKFDDIIYDDADDIAMEIFGEQGASSSDQRPMISTPNAAPLIPVYAADNRFVSEFDEEPTSTSAHQTLNISDTPKTSRSVKNPFDRRPMDDLVNDTCSPSMFRYKKEKRKRSYAFEWTIEQRSQVIPVKIPDDGSSTAPGFGSPAFEKRTEAVLNQYWQSVHLPSPDVATLSAGSRRTGNLLASSSTQATDATEFLSGDDADVMDESEDVMDEKANGEDSSPDPRHLPSSSACGRRPPRHCTPAGRR